MWYESKKKSSSSGGGHTILDDTGTSLAQESNLQFKGGYVVDDSTNSKTVVNIMRVMDSAHYEQLTEDEKQGIIFVTDESPDIILSGTLTAGSTTLTFTDNAIRENCLVAVYTSKLGVNPISETHSTGILTFTFNPQAEDIDVKVRLE